MTQQGEVLTSKTDAQGLIPGTHMTQWGGRGRASPKSSPLTFTSTHIISSSIAGATFGHKAHLGAGGWERRAVRERERPQPWWLLSGRVRGAGCREEFRR